MRPPILFLTVAFGVGLWAGLDPFVFPGRALPGGALWVVALPVLARSEEHTSELQSQSNLVCRLLLEKKKNKDHDSRPVKRWSISLRFGGAICEGTRHREPGVHRAGNYMPARRSSTATSHRPYSWCHT